MHSGGVLSSMPCYARDNAESWICWGYYVVVVSPKSEVCRLDSIFVSSSVEVATGSRTRMSDTFFGKEVEKHLNISQWVCFAHQSGRLSSLAFSRNVTVQACIVWHMCFLAIGLLGVRRQRRT